MTNKIRQTAIRIKCEMAIPADVADIAEFQVASAKANQLRVLAEEIGVVISFDSKIGNVEFDEDPEGNKTPKPGPEDKPEPKADVLPGDARTRKENPLMDGPLGSDDDVAQAEG